jgi:osmotically-inducible protein OsmY
MIALRRQRIVGFLTLIGLIGLGFLRPVSALSDALLQQRIQEQIDTDKQLEGTHITAAVQESQVVLSGTVWLYSQKIRSEQIAWRTHGVVEVDSEIRVVPRVPTTDQDLTSAILLLTLQLPQLQRAGMSITVTDGHVYLSGTFYDASDVLLLKHHVADIEGVISITISVKYAV